MGSKIITENHSILLHRTELSMEVDYDKNVPSAADSKKIIVSSKKADESLVVIKKIAPVYGQNKAIITASIYDSADALKRVEPPKKEKKTAAAPAPAAPAKKK